MPATTAFYLCAMWAGTESDNNIHRDDLRLHHRRAQGMAINNWNCVLACNMGSTRAHLPRILQIFPVDIFVSYELGCWKIVVSLSIHFPVFFFIIFSSSSQQWRQDSDDGQHENCDDSRPMRMNLTKSKKEEEKKTLSSLSRLWKYPKIFTFAVPVSKSGSSQKKFTFTSAVTTSSSSTTSCFNFSIQTTTGNSLLNNIHKCRHILIKLYRFFVVCARQPRLS